MKLECEKDESIRDKDIISEGQGYNSRRTEN